jgi:ATP adenylyltransferase
MQYLDKSGGGNAPAAPNEDKAESPKPEREKKESMGCVFCDKVNDGPEYDRENLLLLRGRRNFVILNLFPYNSAHLMVVPYEHTDDYTSLDEETTSEMTALVQKMIRVIREEYRPEGFNLGMNMGRVAGAGIADHIHMHIVPRWGGDSNFMPIVGETKVMPELLETTYDRLKTRIKFGE